MVIRDRRVGQHSVLIDSQVLSTRSSGAVIVKLREGAFSSSTLQNCLLFTLPCLRGGAGSPGGRGRFVTNSHCQEHLYWSLPTARTRGATVKISQTLFVCVTPESGHQPPAMNEISKLIRQSPAPPQIYFKTLFRDTTHISLVMLGLVHCLQQSG